MDRNSGGCSDASTSRACPMDGTATCGLQRPVSPPRAPLGHHQRSPTTAEVMPVLILSPSSANRGLQPSLCPTGSCSPLPPPLPPKQLYRTRSLPIVKLCCHQMWATQYPGAAIINPLSGHPAGTTSSHNAPSSPRCREKTSHDRRRFHPKYHGMDEAFPMDFADSQIDMAHLTFATPDEKLGSFFKDLRNKEDVYDKVRQRHLVSLCCITARLQEMLTATAGELQTGVNWADYMFLDSEPCCEAADAWYYRVCTASGSQHVLAAKVYKFSDDSDAPPLDPVGFDLQKTITPHFNIQKLSDCFTGGIPIETLLPTERESSGTMFNEQISNKAPRVAQIALALQLPRQTLADFLKEFQEIHMSEPEDYERLACLLLLQLCTGLEHLKVQGITHCDLCPENLLIVEDMLGQQGPNSVPRKMQLPRLVISNFSKAKPSSSGSPLEQARLAPELLSTEKYKKVDEFQTGILIYEILHQANPFHESSLLKGVDYSTADLPPIPAMSPYSQGLQQLAALLLHADPRGRMSISQAKTVLQVLLWGPRRELLQGQPPLGPDLLQNWVEVKRALLMARFAEKTLDGETAGRLEEWLCCQYFTSITDHELHYAARILHIL